MKGSTFLAILAVVYAVFGLGALIAPAPLFASQGLTLNPSGEVMARAGSTAALGLAVIFWLVRNVESAAVMRAVFLGNAVYVFLEAIVLGLAAASGIAGAATWGGVAIDVVFGAGSVYFYSRSAG